MWKGRHFAIMGEPKPLASSLVLLKKLLKVSLENCKVEDQERMPPIQWKNVIEKSYQPGESSLEEDETDSLSDIFI